MSYWTYVHGAIEVKPFGRTQHEMEYVLKTILDHLPHVTGSEGGMNVYVVPMAGHSSSCTYDEFGVHGMYSSRGDYHGWIRQQSRYKLVVDGSLRDRRFEQTLCEFIKWITRLAKRCVVQDVLVRIEGYDKKFVLDDDERFYEMFEWDDQWCDYLMWERDDETGYPKKLAKKYWPEWYESKVKE